MNVYHLNDIQHQEDKLLSPSYARSVDTFRRLIRGKERHLFEKYRDTYFMFDIHESNRDRFSVTYEEAEEHSQKLQAGLQG